MKWKIIQEPLESNPNTILVSEDGWWKLWLKWDGCMQLTKFYNDNYWDNKTKEHPQLEDTIHICGKNGIKNLKDVLDSIMKLDFED